MANGCGYESGAPGGGGAQARGASAQQPGGAQVSGVSAQQPGGGSGWSQGAGVAGSQQPDGASGVGGSAAPGSGAAGAQDRAYGPQAPGGDAASGPSWTSQAASAASGFFSDAAKLFDRGISKARTVVSDTAVEQRGFMREFVRTCTDGWQQGWHESNGGNLSYRLTTEEVAGCRSFFSDAAPWQPIGIQAGGLRGEFFAVTGAGRHFRTLGVDPSESVGIVEVNRAGDAWRLVWGLAGGRPTSELACHLMVHAVRTVVSGGADRVVYHAHPANAIALTLAEGFDSRGLSRALWSSMSESVIALASGVAVVPWEVPGSRELAAAVSEASESFDTIMCAQHGAFAVGPDFDTAFGRMHTLDKAAGIRLAARAAAGGAEPACAIPEEGIRAIASALDLPVREEFLG